MIQIMPGEYGGIPLPNDWSWLEKAKSGWQNTVNQNTERERQRQRNRVFIRYAIGIAMLFGLISLAIYLIRKSRNGKRN